MVESAAISTADFRALVRRSGLELTSEELTGLKAMYDHYAPRTHALHELDLDAEDLALVFSPDSEMEE